MRDKTNNSVMGLLFLSGDWLGGRWEAGARVRSRDPGWEVGPGSCQGAGSGLDSVFGMGKLPRGGLYRQSVRKEPPVTTPSARCLPSCLGTIGLWSSGYEVLLDSFRLKTRLPPLHLFHP